ncbi:DUF742 domain-containing protein [Streptomyces sp. NPDC000941]
MAAGEPVPHEAAGSAGSAGSAGGAGRAGSAWDAPEPTGRASAVRPFLLTAGRVSGSGAAPSLPVESQVVATPTGLSALDSLAFERHDLVAACRRPQSVAELAAQLRLHLNVVRVLAGDLCTAGHLVVHVPNAKATQDISVLRRVIDGLRAVPDSRGTLRDSS